VANYIGKQYSVAFDIIARFLESPTDKIDPYNEGELMLFQNKCLEQQNSFKEAILHIEKIEPLISDKLTMRVKLAELMVFSKRFHEAKVRWSTLVSEEGENYRFHTGLQTAYLELDVEQSKDMFALKQMELPCTVLNLGDSQLDTLTQLYQSEKFAKSRAARKIILTLVRGEELREALEKHLKKNMRDGVPALYQDVCSLIRQSDPLNCSRIVYVKEPVDFKVHPVTVIASEIVDRLICNLRANGTFESVLTPASAVTPAAVPETNTEADGTSTSTSTSSGASVVENPSALLWCLFLRSHLSELSGDYPAALAAIDECITHTPTALDMLSKKAHLLKKMGAFIEASEVMEYCRTLDLQDRFLNNKATKYLLRADNVPQAMETIAIFTKHEGDPLRTLYELQCNWFELEAAEAHARRKQWGPALKMFYAVQSHFQLYLEDMFDFHGFCLRKVIVNKIIMTTTICGANIAMSLIEDSRVILNRLQSCMIKRHTIYTLLF
jgi:peptide alpha-N-acetyltransferase